MESLLEDQAHTLPHHFPSLSPLAAVPPTSCDQQPPATVDWTLLFSPSLAGLAAMGVSEEGGGKESKGKGGGAGRSGKRVSRPRFAFQTRSASDLLDDGYRWRKYGQKAVKNSSFPRCYVKKQVQRLARDTNIVVTTYEGVHNHPYEKLMEALTAILKQHFLSQPLSSKLGF